LQRKRQRDLLANDHENARVGKMQDRFDEITYHLLGLRSIGSTGPGCSVVKSKLGTVIVAVVVFVHSMLRLLSS